MTTPIEKAQRTIAQALADLEAETDGYVRGVDITDIESTTYKSTRKEIQRMVKIDIEPKPGTNWSV